MAIAQRCLILMTLQFVENFQPSLPFLSGCNQNYPLCNQDLDWNSKTFAPRLTGAHTPLLGIDGCGEPMSQLEIDTMYLMFHLIE